MVSVVWIPLRKQLNCRNSSKIFSPKVRKWNSNDPFFQSSNILRPCTPYWCRSVHRDTWCAKMFGCNGDRAQYLSEKHISRCYFPKGIIIEPVQFHGFSDASHLRWCDLTSFDWLQWKHSHLSRQCQNKGYSHQAPDHSLFRGLWCPPSRSTS